MGSPILGDICNLTEQGPEQPYLTLKQVRSPAFGQGIEQSEVQRSLSS